MMERDALSVLLTGATAGIGRHTALDLARRGFRVFATGRDEAALKSLAAEASGLPLSAFPLDVTSERSISAALGEIDARTSGRGLFALINNAGYSQPGPLELISERDLRAVFDTNIFGLMALTRALVPGMRARGRGRIINVGSIMGRVTMPFQGAYSATKYALEALTEALRLELSPFGISVVMVTPGAIKSEFGHRALTSLAPYREESSPYAPALAVWERTYLRFRGRAAGPEAVAGAVRRALEDPRPSSRYTVPRRAALELAILSRIPTRLGDRLKRRALGLDLLAAKGP
jgi:NAD(P)-dependent dehydrogenase (short-subunit alcohol dehydrogenase family)